MPAGGSARGAVPASPWRLPVVVALALSGGMLVGALAALAPGLFELDVNLSATGLAAVCLVLVLLAAVVRRPAFGLVLIVVLVHLNVSEVLVRRHGLPSLLQMLTLPLLAVGLYERGLYERGLYDRGVYERRLYGSDGSERRRRELVALAGQALTWLLAAWVLVQLASTTFARRPALADARVAEATKAFGLYLLVLLLARTSGRLRLAAWTLLASGSFLAVLGLVQVATGNFDTEYGGLARIKDAHIYGDVFEPRIAGPLGDPNYFAQILLMLVPLALVLGWEKGNREDRAGRLPKVLAFGAAGLMTAATVMTYSRGAALALGLVVGLALLLRGLGLREVLVGLGLAALLVLVLPSGFTERLTTLEQVLPGGGETLHPDSSFEKRRLVTRAAWEMFLDHPVLGVGAGNYTVHYDRYADRVGSAAREYDDPTEAHYPHNLYLEIGAEIGLPGLLVFGAAMLLAFTYLRRARHRALETGDTTTAAIARGVALGLAGYLLSSLFLHGQFQRYLWLLLALAAALEALGRSGALRRPETPEVETGRGVELSGAAPESGAAR